MNYIRLLHKRAVSLRPFKMHHPKCWKVINVLHYEADGKQGGVQNSCTVVHEHIHLIILLTRLNKFSAHTHSRTRLGMNLLVMVN